jgi:hypothetical protein
MAQTEGLVNLRNITDAVINEIDQVEEDKVVAPDLDVPERFRSQLIGELPMWLRKTRTVLDRYSKRVQVMMFEREIGALRMDVESVKEQETNRYRDAIVKSIFWLALQTRFGFGAGGYIIGKDFGVYKLTMEQAARIGGGEELADGTETGRVTEKVLVN